MVRAWTALPIALSDGVPAWPAFDVAGQAHLGFDGRREVGAGADAAPGEP